MSVVAPIVSPPKSPSERLGRAVTIATVAGFIAQTFGAGLRGMGVVFLLSLGLYYFFEKTVIENAERRERLQNLPITPTGFIAILLLATLAGGLLRQHWINSNTVDVAEMADTFHWRLRFCFSSDNCVANALGGLAEKLGTKSDTAPEQLFADQALGEIVRTSPKSMALLNLLGIYGDSFLGTGESIPSGSKDLTSTHIPEYLVPNYSENHAGVLAWSMEEHSEKLQLTMMQLLETNPINHQSSLAGVREAVILNRGNEALPSLVRFAMVPDLKRQPDGSAGSGAGYQGCLGRPERRRVFFSSLDYMVRASNSVKEAADLSGYRFVPGAAEQHLYVFMFAPVSSNELIRPTWKRVLAQTKEEFSMTPACREGK